MGNVKRKMYKFKLLHQCLLSLPFELFLFIISFKVLFVLFSFFGLQLIFCPEAFGLMLREPVIYVLAEFVR